MHGFSQLLIAARYAMVLIVRIPQNHTRTEMVSDMARCCLLLCVATPASQESAG